MSNNFDIVEALWLRRERKRRTQKIIEGAPPLTYTAKKVGTLKNYRIYGQTVDGASVGDLVTEGDHAGEYRVPVTIEGKNLLNHIYASSGTTAYDGVSIRNDGGVLILNGTSNNGSYVTLATAIKLPIGTYILTGVSENLTLRFQKTSTGYGYDDNGAGRKINCLEEVTSGICTMKFTANYTYDNVKVYPMIRKADIEDDTYEPYRTPVTTPIYLPEQIKKVGDEAEYIDYGEQKFHRISGADLDVTLPALPTIAGTNTLSVGTQVQPSKVIVKGKISQE